MVAVINYTLPAIQIVYHLATLGNVTTSILGLDESRAVLGSEQSQPQQSNTLPEGYVPYLELGFAYKHHDVPQTWPKARNICQKEGAQLAVMDSFKKHEFFKDHDSSGSYKHAGIIRTGTDWTDVNTGTTLSSLPWNSGFPSSGNNECVYLDTDNHGLINTDCSLSRNYACERPITVSYTVTAN